MMKKAGLFMMVSILCFLFAACGSESGGSFSSSNPSGSVIQPEEPNSNTDGFSEVEYGLINLIFIKKTKTRERRRSCIQTEVAVLSIWRYWMIKFI